MGYLLQCTNIFLYYLYISGQRGEFDASSPADVMIADAECNLIMNPHMFMSEQRGAILS